MPTGPWVLHATLLVEADVHGFIDIQATARSMFDSRLLVMRVVGEGPPDPHWIVAGDRLADYVRYRSASATGGRSLLAFARRMAANPPAVVHGHYGPIAVTLERLARRVGAPLFVTFYGYDASVHAIVDSRRWRARYRRLFADAAGVFAEGPAMGAKLEALGCPADKVHVVRLPAYEEGLAECRHVVPPGFVVSCAGRFVEKKGFDTAIRAFARALRGRPDARLVLVGGGPLEDDLRRLAQDEGVAEQVTWHGFLPFVEFTNLAAAASVMLFPSRRAENGDSEGGAPMTLVEMQWLGVPAIVSDHDDLPFAAAPELPVLGATDVDAWAEALRTYYDDRESLEALGRAGMRFVREHNTVEANMHAREAVYAAALARSS